MKTIFRVTVIGLLFVQSLYGQDPKPLYEKSDQELAKLNLGEAKKLIEQAYTLAPNNYEVLCRYSRIMILFGDTQAEGEQEKNYLRAYDYADAAVKLNPQGSIGLVRRAAANGKVSLYKGILSVADLVKATRDDVEKAIKFNNGSEYTLASAHYILGRVHLKLSEQPKIIRRPLDLDWGNTDDALLNLKKATELRKGYIMFQLEYARALIKKKQIEDAKKELDSIAAQSPTEFGDDQNKVAAKKLREELN